MQEQARDSYLQCLLLWLRAVYGIDAVEPLFLHLQLRGVVHVGVSLLDELPREVSNLVERIRRVRDLVGLDAQCGKIRKDGILELRLFFGRVGVVEPNDELALVLASIELVEERRLHISKNSSSEWEPVEPCTVLLDNCKASDSVSMSTRGVY